MAKRPSSPRSRRSRSAGPTAARLDRLRLALVVEESVRLPTPLDADDLAGIARFLHELLRGVDREHFVVLFFDASLHLCGYHVASIGTLDRVVVEPSSVFVPALLANARAVMVAHNHPSGSTMASLEDLRLTRRLVGAGRILGIAVLDHLVLAEPPRFTSLVRR